jgi:circadian clock protein KaiB
LAELLLAYRHADREEKESTNRLSRRIFLAKYLLTLYVTGSSPRAKIAIANLQRICENELNGQYELEIVDVLEHPQRAEDEKILATPTLIKQLPPPLRRVIGDLSDKDKVLLGLEVQSLPSSSNNRSEAR